MDKVMLLDDPLLALDAKVSNLLLKDCIIEFLNKKQNVYYLINYLMFFRELL
jgi:ABC-type sulfate/molybdate transport systems ATPase subunit